MDAELTADQAVEFGLRRCGMLWRDDYNVALQVLDAMRRRRRSRRSHRPLPVAQEFNRRRQHRAHTAQILGSLLVELQPGGDLRLRRAPDTADAVREVYGELDERVLVPLQELLGVLNVHRQRREGIPIKSLGGAHIRPHYGVFAPTRQDYIDLVGRAPLPPGIGNGNGTAFDIGTGTGVLSALLIARGVGMVVATDCQSRAVECARDNVERLDLSRQVVIEQRDLFPRGKADLVVMNPPWIPGTPRSAVETGVYDRHGGMSRRFLRGVRDHLKPGGEAWLLQSTLAEHLGLRRQGELSGLVAETGLHVVGLDEATPCTAARSDERVSRNDPIAAARRRERLQLWRLGPPPER
ncbi:methyltransferase [Pseudonocardia phyllosphaerae]|uniref:methyltransferase n=1 Tax=Pseudonocardia phyllosphaerae TaxID=3390502 RepID=UPI00397AFECA